MRLLALIPAYEAEASVRDVVSRTRAHVPDVLVIDDGSRDGTLEAARSSGAEVMRHEVNRGKGAALRSGFARALEMGVAGAITVDADGQHDPGEIPRIVSRWRETRAGLVIGSRAHLEDEMTPARRFGNRFSRGAVSLFAGVPVPDPQSGFRLYDVSVLRSIRLRGVGYEMESEVVVKAARAGIRIESVPVSVRRVEGTATSHFRPWRDTARICVAVVRSRFWDRRGG